MKVFVSADLEGIGGVVSWEQTLPDRDGYAQACAWMTAEVRAVADVALERGAERLVIADSHYHGQNLDADALPVQVELVRAGPRRLGMVHGVHLDEFDVVLCIGFHTGAHEIGMLNHTKNGAGFHEIRLDGEPVDELDLVARTASFHGAPIGLVTGDRAMCESASRRFPHVEVVSVKDAIGRMSGLCLSPAASTAAVAEGAGRAIDRAAEGALPLVASEVEELEVEFTWHHPAEVASFLPQFERVDASTVRVGIGDIDEVVATLEFLSGYRLVPFP
ncbi:MAG: M55 family metallopeptidase [Actinomycetota bacterium]